MYHSLIICTVKLQTVQIDFTSLVDVQSHITLQFHCDFFLCSVQCSLFRLILSFAVCSFLVSKLEEITKRIPSGERTSGLDSSKKRCEKWHTLMKFHESKNENPIMQAIGNNYSTRRTVCTITIALANLDMLTVYCFFLFLFSLVCCVLRRYVNFQVVFGSNIFMSLLLYFVGLF